MSSKATSALTYMLHEGDCLEWLRSLPGDSVDSCVTDPPYGLSAEPDPAAVLKAWLEGEEFHHKSKGFMNKQWDSMVPGPTVWKEIRRVLKPGGMFLVFAGTRTWDLMSMAIRLAGFENRDTVRSDFGVPATAWSHGQGFPKGKSQFKPAWEPILVFRKPGSLREYRIDECRVAGNVQSAAGSVGFGASRDDNYELGEGRKYQTSGRWPANAVFSHTTSCVKVGEKGVKGETYRTARKAGSELGQSSGWNAHENGDSVIVPHSNPGGKETVADWRCAEGCPARDLDAQTSHLHGAGAERSAIRECGKTGLFGMSGDGQRFGDSVGASRFFHQFSHDPTVDLPTFIYQAKASRSERERGCEGLPGKSPAFGSATGDGLGRGISATRQDATHANHHPTVKPLTLLRHLCRLVTPVGGTVLDPFAGSGTTGCAAMLEGLSFLGAEREAEYVAIARARIGYYFAQSNGVSDGGATRQKSNVAQQKKSNVAQQNATKLRTLRNLPKRTI